ncbi:hypothetical protein Nepgr_015643 [Nepenthes gracilis]|uniref:Uncharacterized protein n=1 Tax=Nepenthes gracilis TaxID=150966 RepID=A0AAD3SNM2_NEPGR|nr:hypothetical protein Nepgr_015643 [Nepenthes gracilis]
MTFFDRDQSPSSSKRCRFLISVLKEVFSNCNTCIPCMSCSSQEDDIPIGDFDDEQEVIVSTIRSRAMEEKYRRRNDLETNSFSLVFFHTLGELLLMAAAQEKGKENEDEERDDFLSVKSHFSCCSIIADSEAFFSVKTDFSCCSSLSLNGLDYYFQELRRRSLIQEFCHCEGWPFGLCRKALLLPPLPKSPTESWSWRRGAKIVKI